VGHVGILRTDWQSVQPGVSLGEIRSA